jgi:ABC-type transport system involved in cytochrome bd biosynthesis fused ATPase/permease subunit
VTRNRWYLVLMGSCVTLVILAWTVVRLFSVTAAVVMSAAALFIPPIAAIFVNAGDESSRRLLRPVDGAIAGHAAA